MSPEARLILSTCIRVVIVLLGAALLAHCAGGCANFDRYDRSYSLSYEGAKATVTLSPRNQRALPINQDIPPQFRQ